MEFAISWDFANLSYKVTFPNTSTNLLAMVYEDEKFKNTELYNNIIVKSRFRSQTLVLAVTRIVHDGPAHIIVDGLGAGKNQD